MFGALGLTLLGAIFWQVSAAPDIPGTWVPQRTHLFQASMKVKTVACSADGKLIAIANGTPTFPLRDGWERSVEILDTETGKTIVALQLTTSDEDAVLAASEGTPHFEVEALAFSPDGSVVAVGTGIGQVKLFDPRTGELVRSLDDGAAKLAEKKTPEKLKSLARAMGSIASLAFSPDGRLLAMCGESFDDIARDWGGISRLGRTATGPGRLKVWEVNTGKLIHDLVGHDRHAEAVCFSPDGKLLASAGSWMDGHAHGTGVILWNLETGTKVRTFMIDSNGGARSLAISPDSKLVAICSQRFDKDNDASTGVVNLIRTGTRIMEWQQTVPGWAKPAAFSPDGKSVALLCGGQSIRFLDTESGAVQREVSVADAAQNGRWNDFAILPLGHKLAIGGSNAEQRGFVAVWDLNGAPVDTQ